MRIKTLAKIAVFTLVISIVLVHCKNKQGVSGVSGVTGWKYNDPKSTDFVVKEGIVTQTPMGMVVYRRWFVYNG